MLPVFNIRVKSQYNYPYPLALKASPRVGERFGYVAFHVYTHLLNGNLRTCQHETFLPKGTGEEEIQVTYCGNKKLYS